MYSVTRWINSRKIDATRTSTNFTIFSNFIFHFLFFNINYRIYSVNTNLEVNKLNESI